MQTAIATIEAFVRREMGSAAGHDLVIGHGYLHVDRVRRHALRIGDGEGVDRMDLVETAALLHDIGLRHVESRADHAAVSSALARDYLHGSHFFAKDEINAVVIAIARHSDVTPIPNLRGASLDDALTAILREADVLDALGAVGIMRAFMTKHARPPYDATTPAGDSWSLSGDQFADLRRQGRFPTATVMDQINLQIAIYDNLRSDTARQLGTPLVAFTRAYVEQLIREVGSQCPAPS